MQTQQTLGQQLMQFIRHGGMTVKLIFVNTLVFLLIQLISITGNMIGGTAGVLFDTINTRIFALDTYLSGFVLHPWGLFTSIFAHFRFTHFLFNMLFLYFSGRMFEQVFDRRRLLYTYLLGGVAGGIFEILSHLVFPGLSDGYLVVGASGSIMAIFIALAFYRPSLTVNIWGILPVRIIILAVLFIVYDLVSLGMHDGTAHFAHIGGAAIGLLSIQNLHSRTNIIAVTERIGNAVALFFQRLFNPRKTHFKVYHNKTGQTFKSDEQYNVEAKKRQQEIDRILDKISKSGYESLSKAEKAFLFNQSNNKRN